MLPKAILHQILQNLEDCKDIMSFCQTSKAHHKLCEQDLIYILTKAIEKKYGRDGSQFTKLLFRDIKRSEFISPPFAYLSGTGLYQREFDSMPDTPIHKLTAVTWKDIQNSLKHLSKSFKNNQTPKMKKYYALLIALRENVYKRKSVIPLDTVSLVLLHDKSKLIHNGDSKFTRERLKYIGLQQCDSADPVYKMLKSQNFDLFIDELIKFNKHRFSNVEYPLHVEYPLILSNHTPKQIVKILCSVLNGIYIKLYDVDNKFNRFETRALNLQ